ETYLRGVQIADDAGAVTFSSIFPGCYAGRWPHLHFEVFPDAEAIVDADNAILTSQIALPQEESAGVYELEEYAGSAENLGRLTLESDNVFSDGWDQQLASLTGALEGGYAFSIDVPIDTSTEPEGGGAPDQGGPGEPGHAPAGGPPAGDDPPPEAGEGDRPRGHRARGARAGPGPVRAAAPPVAKARRPRAVGGTGLRVSRQQRTRATSRLGEGCGGSRNVDPTRCRID